MTPSLLYRFFGVEEIGMVGISVALLFGVGVIKIILMELSSGIGETTFFPDTAMPIPTAISRRKPMIRAVAERVFVRSSIV